MEKLFFFLVDDIEKWKRRRNSIDLEMAFIWEMRRKKSSLSLVTIFPLFLVFYENLLIRDFDKNFVFSVENGVIFDICGSAHCIQLTQFIRFDA